MKYLAGALITIVAIAAGALLFPFSGIFDTSASDPHTRFGAWYLHTLMRHSVKARADEIVAPPLNDARVAAGANHYRGTCVACHGGPGVHGEAGGDMQPEPPMLTAAVQQWSDAELFWIIKNGIKMTAMPSFASEKSDGEIWDIVAFLRKLPNMNAQQYAEISGSGTPELRLSVFGRDDLRRTQEQKPAPTPNQSAPTERP